MQGTTACCALKQKKKSWAFEKKLHWEWPTKMAHVNELGPDVRVLTLTWSRNSLTCLQVSFRSIWHRQHVVPSVGAILANSMQIAGTLKPMRDGIGQCTCTVSAFEFGCSNRGCNVSNVHQHGLHVQWPARLQRYASVKEQRNAVQAFINVAGHPFYRQTRCKNGPGVLSELL